MRFLLRGLRGFDASLYRGHVIASRARLGFEKFAALGLGAVELVLEGRRSFGAGVGGCLEHRLDARDLARRTGACGFDCLLTRRLRRLNALLELLCCLRRLLQGWGRSCVERTAAGKPAQIVIPSLWEGDKTDADLHRGLSATRRCVFDTTCS